MSLLQDLIDRDLPRKFVFVGEAPVQRSKEEAASIALELFVAWLQERRMRATGYDHELLRDLELAALHGE